jgi:transcriptional regulator with GAF, ATPase, and Fis domain
MNAFRVDVRVVCATHRNLHEMVDSGEFREDLMFRINPFEIWLPPLRSRLEDIPALANYLFCRFRPGARAGGHELQSRSARHSAVSRLAGQCARAGECRRARHDSLRVTADHSRAPAPELRCQQAAAPVTSLGPTTLRELEMQAIQEAIERHEGNKASQPTNSASP